MIISKRSPESGDIYALIAGTVARDAKFSEEYGGKAAFSIKYGSCPSKDDPKKRQGLFFNCVARKSLSQIGVSLEKGDRVLVAGRVDTRTYQSRKTGQEETWVELDCEIILPQDIVSMGLAAVAGSASDADETRVTETRDARDTTLGESSELSDTSVEETREDYDSDFELSI